MPLDITHLIVKRNSIPKISMWLQNWRWTVMAIEHKDSNFWGSISPRKYCHRFWTSVIKKFSKLKK